MLRNRRKLTFQHWHWPNQIALGFTIQTGIKPEPPYVILIGVHLFTHAWVLCLYSKEQWQGLGEQVNETLRQQEEPAG